jgi:hypothetical protein
VFEDGAVAKLLELCEAIEFFVKVGLILSNSKFKQNINVSRLFFFPWGFNHSYLNFFVSLIFSIRCLTSLISTWIQLNPWA